MHAEENLTDRHRMVTGGWRIGLVALGPVAALICWWLMRETELTPAGRATLAMMVWMAVWWMTEATDLVVTSLLPVVCFPLLGVAEIRTACQPYADPVIFLFLGSFIVALAIQRWGLGFRISLVILSLFGTRQAVIVGGIMTVTGLMSMFISNTATVAMMLPIAISIIALQSRSPESGRGREKVDRRANNFPVCLLLGTAYASSIGGVATTIGTPPNLILVSFLSGEGIPETMRLQIPFAHWMLWGVPFSFGFGLVTWFVLVRLVFPLPKTEIAGSRELIREELRKLGRISRNEMMTLAVFSGTVVLWLFRSALCGLNFGTAAEPFLPLAGMDDTTIVMAAALLLFLIPCRDPNGASTFLMNWETARTLPWNVLLLFGGGLSLAAAISSSQVAEFLGRQLAFVDGLPTVVIILLVVTLVVFLTELTSNMATTAAVLPILAGLAEEVAIHPALLCIPAAMSASCAFMLPVATAPIAIVFGSCRVSIASMVRAVLVLNLVSIVCITLISCTLLRWCLGI